MAMNLADLANTLSGKLIGNPDLVVSAVTTLELAGTGQVAILLEKKKKQAALASRATVLIVPEDYAHDGQNVIQVKNPRAILPALIAIFEPVDLINFDIHSTAVIALTAVIGPNVKVGPYCVIGEHCELGDGTVLYPHVVVGSFTKIGKNCRIYPQVSIYHHCSIGNNVIIHSGSVIGTDGFGYVPEGKTWIKVPQIGRVIIEDDVEIGGNNAIDRGALGDTIIGAGTKIDNLVHMAHNTIVGKSCAITAQVGFAGSTTLGDHVQIAGQAGFSGHLVVGDDVIVMGKAGVSKDIPAGHIISGFPAQDHKAEFSLQAKLRRLPEKVDQILKLLKDKGVMNDTK